MKRNRPLLFALMFVPVCVLTPFVVLAGDDVRAKAVSAPVATPATAVDAPANNREIHAEKARADKKALVATHMALTEGEAKAFWPLYDEYQKSQIDLSRREIQIVAGFLEAQQKGPVDDAAARKVIDDMLVAEQAEVDFRKSFAPKLSKVLPPIKVARYLQIESKMYAVVRAQLATRIPLVGSVPPKAK